MGRESLHSEYSERIAAELRAQKARLNLTVPWVWPERSDSSRKLTCSPRLKPGEQVKDGCHYQYENAPHRHKTMRGFFACSIGWHVG